MAASKSVCVRLAPLPSGLSSARVNDRPPAEDMRTVLKFTYDDDMRSNEPH